MKNQKNQIRNIQPISPRQLIVNYLRNNNYHIVENGYDYLNIKKDSLYPTLLLNNRLVEYLKLNNIEVTFISYPTIMRIYLAPYRIHIITLDFV